MPGTRTRFFLRIHRALQPEVFTREGGSFHSSPAVTETSKSDALFVPVSLRAQVAPGSQPQCGPRRSWFPCRATHPWVHFHLPEGESIPPRTSTPLPLDQALSRFLCFAVHRRFWESCLRTRDGSASALHRRRTTFQPSASRRRWRSCSSSITE